MRILTTLAVMSLAMASFGVMAAPQQITVYDGSAATPTPNPIHPMVAVDSAGRSHIVWSMISPDTGGSTPGDYYNIFYKLIGADGTTLIDTTQISSNTDDQHSFKPQIAVSGTDTVYVAWHNKNGSVSDAIRLIGLNPSLAPEDGTATTLATIQRFPENTSFTKTDTGGGTSKHPYVAADSTGKVQILVSDSNSNAYCATYNPDGSVASALKQVATSTVSPYGNGTTAIALDANDKMHILSHAYGPVNNNAEIFYSMVDCASGSVLIPSVEVSTDDTVPSMQPNLAYKNGIAYISWIDSARGNNNCGGGGNKPGTSCTEPANVLEFTVIKPSLAPQDGTAVTLASITTLPVKSIPVTTTSIGSEWYPYMGFNGVGQLEYLYYGSGGGVRGGTFDGSLYGMMLDTSGNVVTAAAQVANDTSTRYTGNNRSVLAGPAMVYPAAQTIMLALSSTPTAIAGANQAVSGNTTVTLSGSGSDTNATITGYAWTQASGTSVTLSNANTATATFTAPNVNDTLVFNLTVTDSQGNTATSPVSIAVTQVSSGGGIMSTWLLLGLPVLLGLLRRRRKH